MDDTVLKIFTLRRSIRRFTGDPVDRPALVTALKAAMAAPSANNRRPWEFYVVTDRARIREICASHPYAKFGVDAGAVIIPFGLKSGYRWFDQDMAAATENLLLAIAHLGLGATWCGMDDDRQGAIREQIDLPEDAYAFALIPVGVPADRPTPRTQYDPDKVHWA